MIKNIFINISEEFGWQVFQSAEKEFYFKGYLYNSSIETIYNQIDKLDERDIKQFLNNLDGNFAFVYKSDNIFLASVDKVKSISLVYKIFQDSIYIASNIASLKQILGDKYIFTLDHSQTLSFEMSGYTIGNKTVYQDVLILCAGEGLSIKNGLASLFTYYQYKPWQIKSNTYDDLFEKLSDTTLKVIQKVIDSANNRQIAVPLSAGYDSRLIVSILKYLGYQNVICFSYGTKGNFETRVAKQLARSLGYPFIELELNGKLERAYYSSKEYESFLQFADDGSAIPSIHGLTTISRLKQHPLIQEDAIIINGNTGDFISGGHILGKVQSNLIEDEKLMQEVVFKQIILKHFSLWGELKTSKNLDTIKELLFNEFEEKDLKFDNLDKLHGNYEHFEATHRQSKHVLSLQRAYEFYGFEWRLPLWDSLFLNFWEGVPKEFKVNQKLYKEMLLKNNYGNVWKDNIPVNQYDIVPKWIRPIRFLAKIPFVVFLHRSKVYWHQFEVSFFQYWTDPTHMIKVVSYYKTIKDLFKKPRHAVSWMVRDYIKRIKQKV